MDLKHLLKSTKYVYNLYYSIEILQLYFNTDYI